MRKFVGATIVVGFAMAGLLVTSASGGQAETSPFVVGGPESEPFTVPADVCQVTVDAFGAEGHDGANPDGTDVPGGLGGRATATVAVTAGEVLQVNAGGLGGTRVGGFNGGGDGGDGFEDDGGGGGGASDVRRAPNGLADRLVVAGGGGGGGADEDNLPASQGGAGGGSTGADGNPSDSTPPTPAGGGGTQSAGGTAPTVFDPTATVGALGQGGQGGVGNPGGDPDDTGGGGGGGLFGGGGGAGEDDNVSSDGGGGGGGGSGFTPDGTGLTQGGNTGDGQVTISWTVEPGCDAGPAAAVPIAAEPTFTG